METSIKDLLYPSILLFNLQNLKTQTLLCDTVVTNGSVRINAHKAVLAASSPYFQCLFCGAMKSADVDTVISDINSDTLLIIIEYIYSGKIKLSLENVFSILEAADYLQLSSLKSCCEGYLSSSITSENCLKIHLWAETMNLVDLTEKTLHFILDNFDLVVSLDEFLELDGDKLIEMLECPWHNITDQALFKAIMRWIGYKSLERVDLAPFCLKFIDLTNISCELLLKCMEEDSGLNVETVLLLKHAMDLRNAINYDGQVNFTKVERVHRMEEALLCIGGKSDGTVLCSVECLAFRYDGWKYHIPCLIESDVITKMKVLPPMRFRRTNFAIASNRFKVFTMGGCDAYNDLNSAEYYDVVNNEWNDITSLPMPLVGSAATFLNGLLYVTGGRNGRHPTNRLYVYDFKSNSWCERQPMKYYRAHHGLVSMNGMLFAIGGIGGICDGDQDILNSTERYDFMTNSWVDVASMVKKRSHAGFLAHDNCIYAIAGLGLTCHLNCVEIYEPMLNQWKIAAGMGDYRSNFGTTLANGRIYCIGGLNDHVILNSVQKYNAFTDRWHSVYGMLTRRCGVGAATVLIPVRN